MPELKPSRREEVAEFRLGIVGDLLALELDHGELLTELKRRASRRYRPPHSKKTRTYHWKTLQRWLYEARKGAGQLKPASRKKGAALALEPLQRKTLLDIRRAYPSASAELILNEAVRQGLLEKGQISVSTLRRLYREADLPRMSKNRVNRRLSRRKWQASCSGQIWHADVCHIKVQQKDGTHRHYCVHAILDDRSRYILTLEVRETETERDLLEVFCTALLQHPAPAIFFVDNGPCYRGHLLATVCQRLGIRLVHARPYDPEARGKMERLWRTMRQQCADHLGPMEGATAVATALLAWVDAYHRRPHAGLMGDRPVRVYRSELASRPAPWTAKDLAQSLGITKKRRVRKDATLVVDGVVYEVAGWLSGKTVEICVCGLSGNVLGARYQDRAVLIAPCDPVANRHRSRPSEDEPSLPNDLPFHPIVGWLQAARNQGDSNV